MLAQRIGHAHAEADGGGGGRRVDLVAARGGPGDGRGARRQRAVGVVQVVARRRIGGLARVQGAVEAYAVAGQPVDHLRALLAEAAQGAVPDHALGLQLEVAEHVFRRVLDAGLALDGGAAAGVHHATVHRCRATAVEGVQRQDLQSLLGGLQRGGDAGAAVADHHKVGGIVPRHARGVSHPLRLANGGIPVGATGFIALGHVGDLLELVLINL
ncbi:hypothetical protein D3C75_902780 [compost metagenome]